MKQTESKAIPADQFYSDIFKFPLSIRIIPIEPVPPTAPELRESRE